MPQMNDEENESLLALREHVQWSQKMYKPSLKSIAVFPLLLLLSGCGSDGKMADSVDLSVRFEQPKQLEEGTKVEFGGVTIGEVVRVIAGDDETTVELRLDADKAGVVQKNAAAVITNLNGPAVKIINPAEATAETLTVDNGDNLRGLNSSLDEAAWHAGKAIGVMQGVLEQATQSFNEYFESDEWNTTKNEVENGLNDLGEQSAEAAESIRKNVEQMMAELEAQTGETVRDAEKHFGEIEKQFRDFGENGGQEMLDTFESFLESLREAMEGAREQSNGQIEA